MKRITKLIIGKILIATLLISSTATTNARILFVDDVFENDSEDFEIGADDDAGTTPLSLTFGGTNPESITWDTGAFSFSDDIDLNQNQLIEPVIENSATPPASPTAGQIYHDTADGNTYVYNGTGWEDITAVSSTATKVVTVGTGLDYSTIAAASTYLNTLSGGIILLSAENHAITSAVNLTNITLIGKDPSQSTIQVSGAGQMDSFDTRFVYLTLDINAITDDMAIDIQSGSSSLQFEWVDIDVLDSGDSLIDSTAGTAPTTTITFINCDETAGSGTVLKTIATGNLNAGSDIFVSSASGNNLLQLDDWDVTIEGSGNVYTTGTITTIPSDTIFVYPGMHLQGAIDSLASGGSITLLPGTHSITEPLLIAMDDIEINGYGDSSIISASGFASTGDTIGAIQIGAENGTSPADGVVLSNFKLEVSSNIHGIRVTGGEDNQIDNVTLQKISGQGGSGSTADIGIIMLDGTTEELIRPVVRDCRVFGNGGTNYFTDGIHVSSDGSFGGVWGYGTGVRNALVEGNNVDYVRETAYVFAGVDDSSLFNNRGIRMGVGTGAFGIFMMSSSNINMNANVFSGSVTAGTVGIAVSSTIDSIFNNNVLDGISDSGAGFATGFSIGAASGDVLRNSFQNNVIKGASAGTTTAFNISTLANADDNTISNNDITGGTNAWDSGIVLNSSTHERNTLRGNKFTNTTTVITDSGTSTKIGVAHHRAAADPTTGDDSGDGYEVGTLWINTTDDESFILVDSTVGSAVWNQIDSAGGGSGTLDDSYDNDTGERTVTADDGDISWDITSTYNYIVDLQGTGDFNIQNSGVTFASFTDGGDFNITNNLTVGSSSETISDAGFTLDGDDVFIADSLGVEGAIYTDNTETKILWLDINGAAKNSVSTGTKISNRVPVQRLDPDGNSRLLWTFPVPDDWESGTDIEVTVFWSPSNTDTGNVQWQTRYASLPVTDVITTGDFTTLTPTEAASGTTDAIQSETFTLSNTVFAADETIFLSINRQGGDAADTYTGNTDVHEVRIEYTGKKLL